MKKLMIGLLVCLAGVALAETNAAYRIVNGKRVYDMKKRMELWYRNTGGMVVRQVVEPGLCLAVMTDRVSEEDLEDVVDTMVNDLRVSVYTRQEKFSGLAGLSALTKTKRDTAVIAIVDDPSLPQTLVATDDRWAIVNVAALTADKPTKERLGRRVRTLASRAIGLLGGAAWTSVPACVMKPAESLAELDRNTGTHIGPQVIMNVMNYLLSTGIRRGGPCTYREACEEGWAQMPTNDVQRAVWEKVEAQKRQQGDPTARWKNDFKK